MRRRHKTPFSVRQAKVKNVSRPSAALREAKVEHEEEAL